MAGPPTVQTEILRGNSCASGACAAASVAPSGQTNCSGAYGSGKTCVSGVCAPTGAAQTVKVTAGSGQRRPERDQHHPAGEHDRPGARCHFHCDVSVNGNLTITGWNTTIRGGGQGPVLSIRSGVTLKLTGVTVTGGTNAGGNGGGINNAGTLLMSNSKVTGNSAANGGGIRQPVADERDGEREHGERRGGGYRQRGRNGHADDEPGDGQHTEQLRRRQRLLSEAGITSSSAGSTANAGASPPSCWRGRWLTAGLPQ